MSSPLRGFKKSLRLKALIINILMDYRTCQNQIIKNQVYGII